MLCCVITPRMMDTVDRAGTYTSYRRYLIRLVEEGIRAANEVSYNWPQSIHDSRSCING